jgi:AraC-like DNA-binding protein
MAADALSDVLRTVRLTGAVFFDLAGREPWVAASPRREIILPKILPAADHLIAYHVVTMGRCFGSLIGGQPIALEAGEVIVFTHGDPHVMSSSPGMRADSPSAAMLDAATAERLPFVVKYGGDGPPSTNLVCGYLACDAGPFNPLLENLPRVLEAGDPKNDPKKDTKNGDPGWLAQFIRLAVMESTQKRAGGESVLAKLSELMFIEVVRRYLESLPPEQAGWLAGLRDPFVGKALSLMHGKPAHDWTIEELATNAGQSRSLFAKRFTDFVGMPPIQYLAKWRMQIASERLGSGTANLATIAADIGYESEAAFSRAFKKMMGVPPSDWRRRVRPAARP